MDQHKCLNILKDVICFRIENVLSDFRLHRRLYGFIETLECYDLYELTFSERMNQFILYRIGIKINYKQVFTLKPATNVYPKEKN